MHPYTLSIWGWKQEAMEYKTSLGYIELLRQKITNKYVLITYYFVP